MILIKSKISNEEYEKSLIQGAYRCFFGDLTGTGVDLTKMFTIKIKNNQTDIHIHENKTIIFEPDLWKQTQGLPNNIIFHYKAPKGVNGLTLAINGDPSGLNITFPPIDKYFHNALILYLKNPIDKSTTINGDFKILLKKTRQSIAYEWILDENGTENYDIGKQFGWKGTGIQNIQLNPLMDTPSIRKIRKKYPQFKFNDY